MKDLFMKDPLFNRIMILMLLAVCLMLFLLDGVQSRQIRRLTKYVDASMVAIRHLQEAALKQ